jgi:RNA polymerase sigma-70 factor (ECF subfamily)
MGPRREPERMMERPLLEASVARALEDIPEDFRTVLILVDVEGLTYREVAESVGCPIGTVMSRLHRARRAVAQKLGVLPAAESASARSDEVVSLQEYRKRKEAV